MMRRTAAVVVLVAWAVMGGCSSNRQDERPPESRPAQQPAEAPLAEVTLPDLSKAEEAVRLQAREYFDDLQAKRKAGVTGAELGEVYGRLAMVLHAAEYLDAAAPSYENAQALMPQDARWPYYLAVLYQSRGQSADAERSFARSLELQPDDAVAQVRLAQLVLARGDAAAAEPLFAKAHASQPKWVAPLAGLGQSALAARRYEDAVRYLEEGLRIAPAVLSLHAPLANAYRALGQMPQAEAHMKQWKNTAVPLPDTRLEDLEALLQSGLSYELRGIKLMASQDWKGAADLFRQGLVHSSPKSALRRSLHHKLGTVLWMSGDLNGALAQFREVVSIAPASGPDDATAKANYSLGIVAGSQGRIAQSIEYLTRAVEYQPNYREAHLALGDSLRRGGRHEESLRHYDAVVKMDPRSVPARLGYAMALVRLARYVDARDWLSQSLELQQSEEMSYALARILAAAPDVRARDGRRALALAEQLLKARQSIETAETLAMALAEVGDFNEAVSVQRQVVDAAEKAGARGELPQMRRNLALYERRQPCREPWQADHPVFMPGPPA
jgi:tetratricopeptide (TPR) repeat protein